MYAPTEESIDELLAEALRVSDRVIIVEEIRGPKTNVPRAKAFDKEVNDRIHPTASMPVYNYYSVTDIELFFAELDREIAFHRLISEGSDDNGFSETHVFVADSRS
jgi:hypothetical protein